MYSSEIMQSEKEQVVLQFNYQRFVWFLVFVALVLAMVSFGMQFRKYEIDINSKVYQKFDLDGERNIPSFFSMLLLMTTAVILYMISSIKRKFQFTFRNHWLGLSLIFLFLSMDELISLHEILIDVVRYIAGSSTGIFFLGWVIPMGFIVICIGFTYLKFLIRLPLRTRLFFIVSACVYLSGTIGMETVGSYYYQVHGEGIGMQLCMTIEESLEMIGIILFIYTLLEYTHRFLEPLTIHCEFEEKI
ncbi:hypothetical protein QNI16_10945 [Cytophagaceae bacterium YF14B1]|uniref:Uncharacterized protein n=1 Tax=Xanthocytophaga flava TaxID=3048013 RepID=A0AAE3QPT1_9BACT|nr:hypothetical protein [Xanthocytophaga flavus]MDJ1481000.1 hypothetical protein [Xanthocytophaga flavus]